MSFQGEYLKPAENRKEARARARGSVAAGSQGRATGRGLSEGGDQEGGEGCGMAVEDIDWQEQYGDQSHKREGLRSIWVTLLALHISQAVVLPTMYELLMSMHARALMLGYCFAATCLGELCAGPVFSMWYDKRPAKEAVVAALMLNAGGSFLYAVSPNSLTVLFSRFLVGCGCGVGSVLWTMVGGFTNRDSRDEVISSMQMLRHLGFIIGVGLAAVATWQHDSPAVFGRSVKKQTPHGIFSSTSARPLLAEPHHSCMA
jgi:hypothetical protein